jgi:hypothetical protein
MLKSFLGRTYDAVYEWPISFFLWASVAIAKPSTGLALTRHLVMTRAMRAFRPAAPPCMGTIIDKPSRPLFPPFRNCI